MNSYCSCGREVIDQGDYATQCEICAAEELDLCYGPETDSSEYEDAA